MKSRLFIAVSACLLTAFLAMDANAQCRSFAKRKCAPDLTPYKHSGRLTNALVVPGDFADIHLTFNGGSTYRIIVCASPVLEDVAYQIMDTDKNIIYDSETDDHQKRTFDFRLEATQQLIVHIEVPHSDEQTIDIIHQGCVAILTGFKELP